MEQHRPKSDRIIVTDAETSYSRGFDEDVIIHQPAEEQAIRSNQNQSFAISVVMRLVGLGFGSLVALFFLRHYKAGIPGAFPSITLVSLNGIFICILVAITIGNIVRRATQDRQLSPEEMFSNWYRLFTRPVMVYLFWTFVFFVFSGLGNTWFTTLIAGVIMFSSYDLKFKGRGFSNFRFYSRYQGPGRP